jgi:ATP-dependent Clp protease protease subunit
MRPLGESQEGARGERNLALSEGPQPLSPSGLILHRGEREGGLPGQSDRGCRAGEKFYDAALNGERRQKLRPKKMSGPLCVPRRGHVRRYWISGLDVLAHRERVDDVRELYARGVSLGDWLREQLFARRIVLLTGRLDDEAAAKVAAALLALDASGNRPIELHLGSPDGALGAAFVLIDTADTLRSTLRVLCRGQVGGPAIAVVTAADHRAATPHARFHLSQPTARFTGTPEEIAAQSRVQQELLWRLYGRLARLTGRPAEEIAEDMRHGRFLDAREALDYGLIDEITAGK